MCRTREENAADLQREEQEHNDWQYEVLNGDTKLGLDEWLEHKAEAEKTFSSFEYTSRRRIYGR